MGFPPANSLAFASLTNDMRVGLGTALSFPLGWEKADTTLGDLSSFFGGGVGGPFLPLNGGNVTGIINLIDPGGAIQSSRNITWATPSSSVANLPFSLNTTFTGTNLDVPTAPYANPIRFTSTYNNFNGSGFGMRTAQFLSNMGPGTYGAIETALLGIVTQTSPYPPGTNAWAPNTAYALNFAMTNDLSAYVVTTPGTSAPSGSGPTGYGAAIADGSVVWQYLGPGVPRYWAATTSYPTRGELVTNPNNGGMFRVETPGTSGAFPGPVRFRAPFVIPARLASTGNLALSGLPVIDGVQSVAGDRVLAKDQTAGQDNGIYLAAAGAWTRATDADQWAEIFSRWLSVTAGVVSGGLGYLCTNSNGGTMGTTPQTWVLSAQPNINAVPDGSVTWSQKTAGSNAQVYIGFSSLGQSAFNMGGRGPNESIGHQWGGIVGSTVTSNATFLSESIGLEVDDRMRGSARKVVGLQLVRQGNQGLFYDIGLMLGASPGWQPYRNGVQLSRIADPNYGYAFSIEPFGNVAFEHMAGGIDLKMVVADGTQGPFGSGFLFRWFNGQLDQFGAQQMRFGSITPTANGLTIDVTNVELQSIAIISGGANWQLGGTWKGSDGSWGVVHTVDGAGAILTVTIASPSQVPAPGPATITLSPFAPGGILDSLGEEPDPAGIGPTGDPIWPTAATGTPTYAAPVTPTLSLMPSGGATVFGGPVTLPAGSTGAFLPLTGGTVTGATTFSAGLSGAIGAVATNTGAFIRVRSDPAGTQLPINLAGAADSLSTNWLWSYTRIFGSSSGVADPASGDSTLIASNKLILSDGAIIPAPTYSMFYVFLSAAGNTDPTNTASRTALQARIAVNGQTGPSATAGIRPATIATAVAQLSIAFSVHTQGGAGGWDSSLNPNLGYFRGALFGGNDNAWLASGAANYNQLVGREVDTSIQGTATCFQRFGILSNVLTSASQAIGDDAAMVFVSQTVNGNNHKNSIQFGCTSQAIEVTDSLIKVVAQLYPTPSTPALVNGIDFTGGTFSGSAIATPGFSVGGSGATTAASYIIGASGPTITSGSAVPASTQPKGSLYTRTAGGVGTTLYVSQGAGTWNAVAGV